MKKFACLFLLFFPLVSFTQTDAEEIITEIRAHYHPEYSFQADFTMEIDIPESEGNLLTGKLSIKGDKFKFITSEQTVFSDNVNLWYWTKTVKINEVQISYVEEADDIIQLSDVFGVYLDGFDYRLVSDTVFKGRKLALIELTPKEKDDLNPYFKVKVVVDKEKSTLDQLQVFYKDGTVYTFKIENEESIDITDDFFEFDEAANPDTEVIDLR